MTYVCRNCGSDEIRTVEDLSGSCGIIIEDPETYDFDDLGTTVYWDSSTTTGFKCADCMDTTTTLAELVIVEEEFVHPDEINRLIGNIV